jgi:hypothetical protein
MIEAVKLAALFTEWMAESLMLKGFWDLLFVVDFEIVWSHFCCFRFSLRGKLMLMALCFGYCLEGLALLAPFGYCFGLANYYLN